MTPKIIHDRDDITAKIAEEYLGIPTLETRSNDQLDFHQVAVWQVKRALDQAFEQGLHAAGTFDPNVTPCMPVEPEDDRIREHPMYSPSDLRYLRRKGYSDEDILAFWDRDHAKGESACHHRVKVTFEGIELPSAAEAIQHANVDSELDTAILLGGKHYAVPKHTAEHLESQGIAFAYLHDHEMPDGTHRIMTVPVNDDDQ